jgi:4'-phosphopantetheinyl transferase EntD
VLEEILPRCVAVAATRGEIEVDLYPEEEEAVANAVERRRREFTTARACARLAFDRLGLPRQAVPSSERGAPQWPPGVVGSITHCEGYRACAVGRLADVAALGVDAEPNRPLPNGVLDDIALPEERGWLRKLTGQAPGVRWDRLLFCVKESVYKAWFPLARRWLGFEDATVAIDRERGTFSARLLVPGPVLDSGPLTGFSGRWLVRDGLVLAAIALPPRAS